MENKAIDVIFCVVYQEQFWDLDFIFKVKYITFNFTKFYDTKTFWKLLHGLLKKELMY